VLDADRCRGNARHKYNDSLYKRILERSAREDNDVVQTLNAAASEYNKKISLVRARAMGHNVKVATSRRSVLLSSSTCDVAIKLHSQATTGLRQHAFSRCYAPGFGTHECW
jgi:hypothetical protein